MYKMKPLVCVNTRYIKVKGRRILRRPFAFPDRTTGNIKE